MIQFRLPTTKLRRLLAAHDRKCARAPSMFPESTFVLKVPCGVRHDQGDKVLLSVREKLKPVTLEGKVIDGPLLDKSGVPVLVVLFDRDAVEKAINSMKKAGKR